MTHLDLFSFEKSTENKETGEVVIPKWAVDRWKRQAMTPYNYLPETEKESDRKEARKIMKLFDCSGVRSG